MPTIASSTSAASPTRMPLYASGSTSDVPYFTTLKLTAQMTAISTSDASVSQTPGRVDVAWPGVNVAPAVESSTNYSRIRQITATRAQHAWRKVDARPFTCLCSAMHVSFALFADAANLSQEGKLNILGVFDALQVSTLPAVHPRAHLVVHLKGTSG